MVLDYKGEVKIKYEIGGKLVEQMTHNDGKPDLFRIIVKALTGTSISSEVPYGIMVRSVSGSTETDCLDETVPLSQLTYTSIEENNVTIWMTRMTATILYSAFQTSPDASSTYLAYLISKDGKDLASVTLDSSELANLSSSSSAIIEWTLRVQNAQSNT